MRWAVILLSSFLAVSGAAQAGPGDDAEAVANQTIEDSDSILDDVVNGVGEAARDVGSAAERTGQGVGDAAGAMGRAFVAAAKAIGGAIASGAAAIGAAAVSTTRFLASSGAAASLGLSGVLLSLGGGVGGLAAGLGSSAGAGIAASSLGLANGVALVGALVSDGVLSYVRFVADLRPGAMSPIVFGTVATAGAAASTGVGGWAGWNALRKWGVLGSLGGLAGFSRIDDGELLEHPLRQQIFQVIQHHPGIHASGLAREVGVGWGTITHHLEKLERASLVATRKVNNQKCFFENGGHVSRQDMAIASAVKGDTAGHIAAFVQAHPMTSQKALAESLGISPALASFHIKKLASLGVLDRVRHGKETLLTTSEALRRVLASEQGSLPPAVAQEEGFQYSS